MTENEEYTNLKEWSPEALNMERTNLNNIINDAVKDLIEISVEIELRKKMSE